MRTDHVDGWLNDEQRQRILRGFTQPLTASQLARQEDLQRATCSRTFRKLTRLGLVRCLNPTARRSRVFWLTPHGLAHQEQLRASHGLPPMASALPNVDWALYGWVCFNHRSAILRALDQPLQSSAIKRKAKRHDNTLRMSANNVRDVIQLFVAKGIAKPVMVRRRAHPRYELTRDGRLLQALLLAAETRILYTKEVRTEP